MPPYVTWLSAILPLLGLRGAHCTLEPILHRLLRDVAARCGFHGLRVCQHTSHSAWIHYWANVSLPREMRKRLSFRDRVLALRKSSETQVSLSLPIFRPVSEPLPRVRTPRINPHSRPRGEKK